MCLPAHRPPRVLHDGKVSAKVSLLKKNITANFLGNLCNALLGLVFIPVYIKFLGMEAYGLIGFFVTLQSIFVIFDLGLGNTLNREFARLSVQEHKAQEMRDLLRTLEVPFWSLGLIIGGTVILVAPFLAHHWLNLQNLAPVTVQRTIMIMGVALALQWPFALYSGGLQGLQKQVLINILAVAITLCRGLGTVIILWRISPTVEAFFIWQILISAGQTWATAFFLWRSLPRYADRPVFRTDLLRQIWRFAAGVSGISILSTILTQLDKVVLSKMLSLEAFGYYSLAYTLAVNLNRLVTPVAIAAYPHFTNLVATDAKEQLAKIYHQCAQVLSVSVIPAALVLSLFSKEIILLWTQNLNIAEQTYQIASVLVIGTALNGLMHIPYTLQLAYSWTKLTFYFAFVSVLVLAPLIILFTYWFGAIGAAIVWVILNSGHILVGVPLMHRRLLPLEKMRWYKEDIGWPFLVALLVAGTFRLLTPSETGTILELAWLVVISGATLGITALSTATTREVLYAKITAIGGVLWRQ
jgi:O-antigen/teichoic acid export membrane protein